MIHVTFNSAEAKYAAHLGWSKTDDRAARTDGGRRGLDAKFLAEANGDVKRAESARKAFFHGMALKSAKVRQAKKAAREAAGQ